MTELPPSGLPVPERQAGEKQGWFVRPGGIRVLWVLFALILAGVTLLDLVVEKHGLFALENGFGFGAWYGFAACVVLVFASKALGAVLKRKDSYYDD